MAETPGAPPRWIGLDIHKQYVLAVGVNRELEPVYGPRHVTWAQFEAWVHKTLTPADAVVVEMTTNTYEVYDTLSPHVHSVTVVHPPHVALVTRAQVKTDKKAALALAQLHAAGLLPGVWMPPQAVRDLRALVAQRRKLVRLSTQAKNRLHAVLHRHHLLPPEDGGLFDPDNHAWWLALPVSTLERVRIRCDLDTLAFAQGQIALLERYLAEAAAQDERIPLLIQLPGFALRTAITVLVAIGDIRRFPSASHLVGYSGLGARVHSSGQMHNTGRITKAGRRDLRSAMVDAAFRAVHSSPHWQAVFARLEPRLGRQKAIVAVARKLLVVVWHVLTKQAADRHADPQQVACSFFAHAYKVGVANLPDGLSAKEYTRQQLDRLGIGADVTQIPWGSKTFQLPPSRVSAEGRPASTDQES